jgi:hypothetical protein
MIASYTSGRKSKFDGLRDNQTGLIIPMRDCQDRHLDCRCCPYPDRRTAGGP